MIVFLDLKTVVQSQIFLDDLKPIESIPDTQLVPNRKFLEK